MNYLNGLFAYRIQCHQHAVQAERYPQRIRSVMELIQSNYHRPLHLSDLAAAASCSVAHLHDLFLQHTGTSPHQWLIQERLKAAKKKLVSSLDPMKQIAQECGFLDSSSFAHAFKANTGRSPGAFRKHYFQIT
jgi:AraC family transcriptional regulator